MSFLAMWSELVGTVPHLSPFLAQKYIVRAWQDICNARSWSFKQKTGYLSSPDLVNAGTVSVTQFADLVVADVTAAAAFDALSGSTSPPFVGRQFRVGSTGSIYTIVSWDSASRRLILDNLYRDITQAAAGYMVWQAYYPPPEPSFQRWLSIEDPDNGYAFTKLHVPKSVLDRRDPTRSAQGLPYFSIDFDSTDDGAPRYEFWPHPVQAQTFQVTYLTQGPVLQAPGDTIPGIVQEGLVIDRAIANYAIPWAVANAGRFPQLKGINWALILKDARDRYERDLLRAKGMDEGRMLKSKITKQRQALMPPIDATFLQSHDWGGPG